MRRQIGFVTQDTHLFAGTIRENLLFVKPDATEAELLDALDKAACEHLLTRPENGLDTQIGEGGLKMSGGEKQRLSIARALARHPRLLIFDEATSALDSLTGEEITDTGRRVSALNEQITILIAHRLSTILPANTIFVLEKGRIVETGSPTNSSRRKALTAPCGGIRLANGRWGWWRRVGTKKARTPGPRFSSQIAVSNPSCRRVWPFSRPAFPSGFFPALFWLCLWVNLCLSPWLRRVWSLKSRMVGGSLQPPARPEPIKTANARNLPQKTTIHVAEIV